MTQIQNTQSQVEELLNNYIEHHSELMNMLVDYHNFYVNATATRKSAARTVMLARTLKKIRLHARIMEKIARTLRREQVNEFNRKFPDFAKIRKNKGITNEYNEFN